jgi:iron(III) transport system ATP-binding protein
MATTSPASPETVVQIRDVNKQFLRTGGAEVKALDDVSLTLQSTEILVLLGPSGCGKSTLLRCIAGLEHPDSGSITIGDDVVFDRGRGISLPPNERDINMMFQSYALWPHMTLAANVAYPLQVRGVKRSVARSRANDYLELVGLTGLGEQYAGTVSGGQAQRAALARTLISEPAVALFDEPLSNVDAKVRARLRAELHRIHAEIGFTAVYVTHDQVEAMGVASRIAVMREGRILQMSEPVAIYESPHDRYTAEFVGDANMIEGTVREVQADVVVVDTPLGRIKVLEANFVARGFEARPKASVTLMVRPEYILVLRDGVAGRTEPGTTWKGSIESAVYAGSRTEYVCKVDGLDVLVWEMAAEAPLAEGVPVALHAPAWSFRVVAAG